MWERFGFYGMQALIVLYMVKKLGFDDTDANLVWGAASALIYVAPAIGGWIGDKVLGTRRTMLTGAAILASATRCSRCRPTTRCSCTPHSA